MLEIFDGTTLWLPEWRETLLQYQGRQMGCKVDRSDTKLQSWNGWQRNRVWLGLWEKCVSLFCGTHQADISTTRILQNVYILLQLIMLLKIKGELSKIRDQDFYVRLPKLYLALFSLVGVNSRGLIFCPEHRPPKVNQTCIEEVHPWFH